MRVSIYAIFSFLCLTILSHAQLQVAPVFTDDMVLQRNKPIAFYGKALPGQIVAVCFAGIRKKGVADKDSSWKIIFAPQKANHKNQQVIIESRNEKIVLNNILIGDVWLCIGQSNMEWPVMKEAHYDPTKNYENTSIRLYNPTYAGKGVYNTTFSDSIVQLLNQKKFYTGAWERCSNQSIKSMSAVGYYFANAIFAQTNIPQGIINLSIGGAPLEAFISSRTLKSHPVFSQKVYGNWICNDALPVWVRERGRQNTAGLTTIFSDEYGPAHAYKPGYAYDEGIQFLTSFSIAGILCYQGESNAQEPERVHEYAALQKLLIQDYRKFWNDATLPYYFVQLSSIDTLKYKSHLWPAFRNEQRVSLSEIKNSGMAVTSDIGAKDDVHPTNKKDVGERLARWALWHNYHQKIIPCGPLPLKAVYKNGKIFISFKYYGNGLKTLDGKALQGFSIDGKTTTTAVINNNTVEVRAVIKPEYVYYGWQPFSEGNLFNSVSLPASTFKIKVE